MFDLSYWDSFVVALHSNKEEEEGKRQKCLNKELRLEDSESLEKNKLLLNGHMKRKRERKKD